MQKISWLFTFQGWWAVLLSLCLVSAGFSLSTGNNKRAGDNLVLAGASLFMHFLYDKH